MATTNLPGDFSVRGNVIVAETVTRYYGGDPTRIEFLRNVACCLLAGQTVTTLRRENGVLVLGATHLGHDRKTARATSLVTVRAFAG